MPQLNDCRYDALIAQGFTGHTNDMLLAWAQSNGATSNQLNDALLETLIINGATSNTLNDAWYEAMGVLGLVGSRNDRELAFWCDNAGAFRLQAISGFTDGNNCDGLRNVPINFNRSVAFTDHTGVTITNLTTLESMPITSSTVSPASTIVYDDNWITPPVAGDIVEWAVDGTSNYLDSENPLITLQDDLIDTPGTLSGSHEISPIPKDGTVWSLNGSKIHTTGKGFTENNTGGVCLATVNDKFLSATLNVMSIENPVTNTRDSGFLMFRLNSSNEVRVFYERVSSDAFFRLRIQQIVGGVTVQDTTVITTINIFNPEELIISVTGNSLKVAFTNDQVNTLTQTVDASLINNTIYGFLSSTAQNSILVLDVKIFTENQITVQSLIMTNCLDVFF